MSNNNLPSFSEKRTSLILFVILSLYPLVGMGIDLISPSLPAISHNLNASNNFAKNLITLYLLGYALGNFILGILSDALGRRKLMLFGFFFFMLVSLLPIFFEKISVLLFARLCQGFTIAAFGVIGRAVLADILPKEKLIRFATLIATMWGIGPIIGPMIGGYLQFYFGWQACFYFFAIMGFLGLLAMIFVIPETHFQRQPLQYQPLKNNFIIILTHRAFFGIVTLMGLTYSLLIVFNTLGPFIIQASLGYSSIYFGHVALFMGLTFLTGTFLCRRLLQKLSPENLFFYALFFFTIIAAISVVAAFLNPHNIWVIIISSVLMFLECGIIYPAALGKGLSLFRHLAGSGAAVMNLINILITSITALIMSFLHADSAIPLTFIYLTLMLLATVTFYLLIKTQNKDGQTPV
jgi:DHA1 family bicyclomycin/chloramphenicol resistance-like MFS transporter